MIDGIDVSAHQTTTPTLDGLDFLVARAAYGTDRDARYGQHVGRARAAGLLVGAYLFLRHGNVSGQVGTLLDQVGRYGGVDGIAVDLEADGNDPPATELEGKAALEALERAGFAPGLYASTSGYPAIGQAWRWVADYRPIADPPIAWDVWQWTSTGGKLDRDRFDGTRAELAALWKGDRMATRIDIVNAKPQLVDITKGTQLLDVNGAKTWIDKLPEDRAAVLSPFSTTSAGGTQLRAIVYTRPAPAADELLAIYTNQAHNLRDLPAADCTPAAKAAAAKVAKAATDAAKEIG